MFDIHPRSEGRVIGVRTQDRMHHSDYKALVPKLEAMIDKHGRIRILFDMGGFKGSDFQAIWDNFKFGLEHWRGLELIAVVGDSRWESFLAEVIEEFYPGETRYFDISQEEEAWDWLEKAEGQSD